MMYDESLQLSSQKLEYDIPDQRRTKRNQKVGRRHNVSQRKPQAPNVFRGRVIPHQQIRVKEKHDKRNLDHRSRKASESPRVVGAA